MLRKTPLIAGTIRIELDANDPTPRGADDSTLDQLLASLARRSTMADCVGDAEPFGSVLARRLRWAAPMGADLVARANVAQLLDDLRAEFERLPG